MSVLSRDASWLSSCPAEQRFSSSNYSSEDCLTQNVTSAHHGAIYALLSFGMP